jgi:hypothetical protein
MIRRPPTRIELKLDDVQEYEQLRKQRNQQNQSATSSLAETPDGGGSDEQTTSGVSAGVKTRA